MKKWPPIVDLSSPANRAFRPWCGRASCRSRGTPADVIEIVESYGAWLAQSPIPKLFVNAEPGSLLVGRAREFCRTWPNQREVTVKGIHFIQEDAPLEIAAALESFLQEVFGRAR